MGLNSEPTYATHWDIKLNSLDGFGVPEFTTLLQEKLILIKILQNFDGAFEVKLENFKLWSSKFMLLCKFGVQNHQTFIYGHLMCIFRLKRFPLKCKLFGEKFRTQSVGVLLWSRNFDDPLTYFVWYTLSLEISCYRWWFFSYLKMSLIHHNHSLF